MVEYVLNDWLTAVRKWMTTTVVTAVTKTTADHCFRFDCKLEKKKKRKEQQQQIIGDYSFCLSIHIRHL